MEKTLKEKIGYALGDGAANIAWRGVPTFLFIFYTDVFGLNPAIVGLLLLIAMFSDGISDIAMFSWSDSTMNETVNMPTQGKSFSMETIKKLFFYCFRRRKH